MLEQPTIHGDSDKMNRSFCLFFILFIAAFGDYIGAEDHPTNIREITHRLRRQELVIEIHARVLDTDISEEEQNIVWNEVHRRTAMPGSPVGLKLVGSNIVLALQFTPFVRRHGSVLVAQGQIFINDPEGGMRYYTSMQTIPMEFGEPIYFFPLGSSQPDSWIEIILTVNPQTDTNTENEN